MSTHKPAHPASYVPAQLRGTLPPDAWASDTIPMQYGPPPATRRRATKPPAAYEFDAITEFNAKSISEMDAAVNRAFGVLLAVVVGTLLAWALLVYLTPCTAGTLCMAAALPAQPGLLQRLGLALRAWHLRWQLADAQAALAHVEEDLQELPQARSYLHHRVEVLRLRLADCELGARRH